MIYHLLCLDAPAYPPSAAAPPYPYPQSQQPSAPSTGGQQPPTVPGNNNTKSIFVSRLDRYSKAGHSLFFRSTTRQ